MSKLNRKWITTSQPTTETKKFRNMTELNKRRRLKDEMAGNTEGIDTLCKYKQ